MGLSKEEQDRRREDSHVKYLMSNIRNAEMNEPYMFISYKSDNWETVLHDIVYRLVKDHGLNVYFDGDFNGHNPLWTKQFPANMESKNCRGVLAFVNDAYTCSYATLMELLYSRVGCQEDAPPYNYIKKPVVTVNLEKLTLVRDEGNTGLGVEKYDDNTVNIHAMDEKELFDDLFGNACKSEILKKTKKPYKNAKYLSKELCANMAREVLASIGANDNLYGEGSTLEDIVKTIKSECGADVFRKVISEPEQNSIMSGDGSKQSCVIGREEIGTQEVKEKEEMPKESVQSDAPEKVIYKPDGKIYRTVGNGRSYDAFYRMDGDKFTVLRGSRIRLNEKWTPRTILNHYGDKITKEGILLCDIPDLAISAAAKLIEGTSTAGKELLNEKNILKVEVSIPLNENTNNSEEAGIKKDNIEPATITGGGIVEPVGLGGIGTSGAVMAKKAVKLSFREMVDQGIVSVSDEVYVKDRESEIGIIDADANILYKNEKVSLNQYVQKVLGPGSRNAYDYVYHKPTSKLLNELR